VSFALGSVRAALSRLHGQSKSEARLELYRSEHFVVDKRSGDVVIDVDHKAWIRRPDGRHDLIGGSLVVAQLAW